MKKKCKKISTSPQGALFLLRLALGGYFLYWGLDKIFLAGHAMSIFEQFYKIRLLLDEAHILGGLQVVLAVMFMMGVYRCWTYGAVLLFQLVWVGAIWQKLIAPFDMGNQLFMADVALLVGYLALFLARDHDTLFVFRRDKTQYFSDDGRAKTE